MPILYDLISLVIAVIYLPWYLFKRKLHRGFLARLGILPKDLGFSASIWIHAVSVGEVVLIRGILEGLKKSLTQERFVISTVTATGNKIAKGCVKDKDFVTYLPLDFSVIVKKVIDKIRPSLFILAEAEIWPNLISYLYKKNIPVLIVNGRISDASFRGYSLIRFIIRPILNKITLFCVQAERDAQRLIYLGVSRDKIHITGNMKFDIADYMDFKKTCLPAGRDYTDYRLKLGLGTTEKLFIAASTHKGEEEIILGTYQKLLAEFGNLQVLIAPRHPERTPDIEKIVIKYGFRPFRTSRLNEPRTRNQEPRTIFILDAIGQLMSYYGACDIAFVGGSLVKKIGGHNILEPAFLDKPVIFGPHMFNFRDIAGLFLKNQAAILVHNQEELKESIKYLLCHAEKIDSLTKAAGEVIRQNQGATQRNLKLIELLHGRVPS